MAVSMNIPEKILVVDDDPLNGALVAKHLEVSGLRAVAVEGGRTALARAEHDPSVALVLLDIDMPDINGMQVLERLRERFNPVELPVIMATGSSTSEMVVRALDMGANDYVTKPVDMAVMVARVKTHLAVRRLNAELRDNEQRLRLAFKSANDGLWDWDLRNHTVFYSEPWKAMLGYGEAELSSTSGEWLDRVHPDDLPTLRQSIDEHLAGQTPAFRREYRIRHREGSWLWVSCSGIAVFDDDGEPRRMVGSQTDITSSKLFDPLTSLPNRMLFSDRLERVLSTAARNDRGDFAVLLLNLDDFKKINSSLGPRGGDELLSAAAERIANCVRRADYLAPRMHAADITTSRLVGDQFGLLLENLTDSTAVRRVAERIRDAFGESFYVQGEEVFTSVSQGITFGSAGAASVEELLRDAEAALRRAKEQPKRTQRIEIFDQTLHERSLKRLQLESELQHVVEREQLRVFCQPVINGVDERVVGFEALVRWEHPERGLVSPGEFIPVAEEIGQIAALDNWVMHEACRQAQSWIEQGLVADLDVAVNFSVAELGEGVLLEQVKRALAVSGLDPRRLELEVTESIFMQDMERTVATFRELADMGVRIAIDDFGTGYSSFAYLRKLPVSVLKIDKSFIDDITVDDGARGVVESILGMARVLGLKVTAEGVETREQFEVLQALGCDRIQGFYFGRPVPAAVFAESLQAVPAPA